MSPLLGAFYLYELDKAMSHKEVFYIRYMDDILVLAKTRWQLRRAVKTVNQHFSALGLSQHPDKTFIGRIKKGFDFLGYHFNRAGLAISHSTLERFVEQATRLYEQERRTGNGKALGAYVRRWQGWVTGGLEDKHKARQKAGVRRVDTIKLSSFQQILVQPSPRRGVLKCPVLGLWCH